MTIRILGLSIALALTFTALPVDDVSARRRENQSSGMYNPEDNPFYSPTPDEFHAQEYERRRAYGYCTNLFECGAGGRTGYTHLPHRARVEPVPPGFVPLPNRAFLSRYPNAVRVPGGAIKPQHRSDRLYRGY